MNIYSTERWSLGNKITVRGSVVSGGRLCSEEAGKRGLPHPSKGVLSQMQKDDDRQAQSVKGKIDLCQGRYRPRTGLPARTHF